MDLISIALVIVALWIGVVVLLLAMCKASGHADADEERHFAEGRDDVSNQLPAPYADVALGDDRRPIGASELNARPSGWASKCRRGDACAYRIWLELIAIVHDRPGPAGAV